MAAGPYQVVGRPIRPYVTNMVCW